jgi:integrase
VTTETESALLEMLQPVITQLIREQLLGACALQTNHLGEGLSLGGLAERLRSGLQIRSVPGKSEGISLGDQSFVKTRLVLEDYSQAHLAGLSTGTERLTQLQRVLAPFLNRDFASIRQAELAQALAPWSGATRNRYRAALTHLWRWARERELTTLSPTFSAARETSRDAVLSLPQLRALYAAAPQRGDWAGFCRLLILTGQRRSDVMNMRPGDIRGDRWEQPTSKNSMPHTVHLTDRAQTVIRDAWVLEEFEWTGKTTYSDMKARWFADAKVPASFRLHDIRRSFATHLSEGGTPEDVVDRVLNHVAAASSKGVARVYNRAKLLDQRKEALEAWDRLLFPAQGHAQGTHG